jgi:hypothetical protein
MMRVVPGVSGSARAALALLLLLDGEEDHRAVGAVRRGAGWVLHGWMASDGLDPRTRQG